SLSFAFYVDHRDPHSFPTRRSSDLMFNTPPTYAIYIAGLVFKWLKRQGGIPAIEAENIRKAEALYGFLDTSDFYQSTVHPSVRSRMTVPFFLQAECLKAAFGAPAEPRGALQL